MTMTYTFTHTTVRYSTNSEANTISLLLNKIGATNLADNGQFFAETAGIARFELDEKRTLKEHASLINAHYLDAENLVRNNLQVEIEGNRVTGYLADLMERISIDTNETNPKQWFEEVWLFLVDEKKLPLTKEQCFGLGLATFFLAGPPEYRRNWSQRESLSPTTLMAESKLTPEVVNSIKKVWDEISPLQTLEGQTVPQSIK